jgi:hypothetical protein
MTEGPMTTAGALALDNGIRRPRKLLRALGKK